MKNKKTIGEEKSLLSFQRVLDTVKCQNEVKRIREALDIPLSGFSFKKIGLIKLPEKSEFSYKMVGKRWNIESEYAQEVKSLLGMFIVMNSHLSLLLRNYIYYNKLLLRELDSYRDSTRDMCVLFDAEEEGGYFCLPDEDEGHRDQKTHNKIVEDIIYKHPISIRIRSDTSQRVLLDFIKHNWAFIEEAQGRYLTENDLTLKYSRRKINTRLKERDDFIYKNKDLPRKELWTRLNKKYKNALGLEYASLSKIISLEKKRREGK
jgi:hypothetical protein